MDFGQLNDSLWWRVDEQGSLVDDDERSNSVSLGKEIGLQPGHNHKTRTRQSAAHLYGLRPRLPKTLRCTYPLPQSPQEKAMCRACLVGIYGKRLLGDFQTQKSRVLVLII
jgi:hypothetical protein